MALLKNITSIFKISVYIEAEIQWNEMSSKVHMLRNIKDGMPWTEKNVSLQFDQWNIMECD